MPRFRLTASPEFWVWQRWGGRVQDGAGLPSCLRIMPRSGLWPLCSVGRESLRARCSPLAVRCLGSALLLTFWYGLLRLSTPALGFLLGALSTLVFNLRVSRAGRGFYTLLVGRVGAGVGGATAGWRRGESCTWL